MIVLMMAYLYKRLYLDHRLNKPGSVIKMPHFLMRLLPVNYTRSILLRAQIVSNPSPIKIRTNLLNEK